jgi:hypothetical protein
MLPKKCEKGESFSDQQMQHTTGGVELHLDSGNYVKLFLRKLLANCGVGRGRTRGLPRTQLK